jgi:hypothetical protein
MSDFLAGLFLAALGKSWLWLEINEKISVRAKLVVVRAMF